MVKIKALKEKERELLSEVLTKTNWDLEKTARLLKIPLAQLKRKVREHEMQKQDKPQLQNTGPITLKKETP